MSSDNWGALAMARFDAADWALSWPRDLFVEEGNRLLTTGQLIGRGNDVFETAQWAEEAELLLQEAFVGSEPVQEFRRLPRLGFLKELLKHAGDLPEEVALRPYWPKRQPTSPGTELTTPEVAMDRFVQIIADLEASGYFDQALPRGCVDDSSSEEVDASAILESHLGIGKLWPLSESRPTWDEDSFFGLIEVLYNLVARPRRRWWPEYGSEWHYSDFARQPGRLIYRWRVNRLLAASTIPYRLASSGEDEGRLVSVPSDQARAKLVETMAARGADDPVGHAVTLFRSRDASVQDRRSAVVTLAGVLEGRRSLLRKELLSKDERALFEIANGFGIRHQRADQQTDYDPAFLDWLFWWYLATVDLTDQMVARPAPE